MCTEIKVDCNQIIQLGQSTDNTQTYLLHFTTLKKLYTIPYIYTLTTVNRSITGQFRYNVTPETGNKLRVIVTRTDQKTGWDTNLTVVTNFRVIDNYDDIWIGSSICPNMTYYLFDNYRLVPEMMRYTMTPSRSGGLTFKIKVNQFIRDMYQVSVLRTDTEDGWDVDLHLRVQLKIVPKIMDISAANSTGILIPKLIFQTWKTRDVVPREQKIIGSWAELNPEFTHKVYDDDDCIEFMEKYFVGEVFETYQRLSVNTAKADLWRYCVLYIYGGVYVDIDCLAKLPLRNIIKPNVNLIIPEEYGTQLYQGFIVTEPRNLFIKLCIDTVVANVKSGMDQQNVWALSGPIMAYGCLNKYHRNGEPYYVDGNRRYQTKFGITEIIKHDRDWGDDLISYDGQTVCTCQHYIFGKQGYFQYW
jgi:hypothetical protein